MKEIDTQIIQGFLTDVADISWHNREDWSSGTFPARLGSLYQITLYPNALDFWVPPSATENYSHFNIHFKIEDGLFQWVHHPEDQRTYYIKNDDPTMCSKQRALHMADPKFFQNFIQIVCLTMGEVNVSEFILRRIINKPKFNVMCSENKMRHCRRHIRRVMSCEEIDEFIWKS